MTDNTNKNLVGVAVGDVFDIAEKSAQAASNAALDVVGAAGDVGQTLIGEVEGVGNLTVTEASDLLTKLLGRLRNVAGA